MKHIKKFENIEDNWTPTRGITVGALKDKLSKFDDSLEVMVLDGFNGGGDPRNISISSEPIEITSEYKGHDCEGKIGDMVVILSYGNY